jgi:hypothetical protein
MFGRLVVQRGAKLARLFAAKPLILADFLRFG